MTAVLCVQESRRQVRHLFFIQLIQTMAYGANPLGGAIQIGDQQLLGKVWQLYLQAKQRNFSERFDARPGQH
ncbi:hypothetical protein D3C85_1049970 [compost metagenome]